jgi:hypothetical protein
MVTIRRRYWTLAVRHDGSFVAELGGLGTGIAGFVERDGRLGCRGNMAVRTSF